MVDKIQAEKNALIGIINNSYKTTRLGKNNDISIPSEQEEFREDMINGIEKLFELRDKFKNQPALVMGLGPSLLNINKEEHRGSVKLVCNNFWKVPDFFNSDDFKPDFWGAANSHEALLKPFEYCLENDIKTIVTVPLKREFKDLLEVSKRKNKSHLVVPWFWEAKILQIAIANKFDIKNTYSNCNTVTNHLIAIALWLGCNPIKITGFDLSYSNALKNSGTTHAGFTQEDIKKDALSKTNSMPLFDIPSAKQQVVSDLSRLTFMASENNIEMYNLSYAENELPFHLTNPQSRSK